MKFRFEQQLIIRLLLWVSVSFICCACSDNQVDTKQLAREVKKRKIGRIKEAEIISAASVEGNRIVSSFDSSWRVNLKNKLDSLKVDKAKPFCMVRNGRFGTFSLQEVRMNKLGALSLQQYTFEHVKEKEMVEAYIYNVETKLPLTDNVQKIDNQYILFTKPIMYNEVWCGRCHQYDGKNNFAGIWSVRLSKKKLIETAFLN